MTPDRTISVAQLEVIFLLLQQNKILLVKEKDIPALAQAILKTLDETTKETEL